MANSPPKILAIIITVPTLLFANAGLIDRIAVKINIKSPPDSLKIKKIKDNNFVKIIENEIPTLKGIHNSQNIYLQCLVKNK